MGRKRYIAWILAAMLTLLAFTGCQETSKAMTWSVNVGGGDYDTLQDAVLDGSDLISVGYMQSSDGNFAAITQLGLSDGLIVKTDSSGQILWSRNFGGSGHDVLHTIVKSTKGSYIIGGYSSSADNQIVAENARGQQDAVLAKMDQDGNVTSVVNFGGSDDEWFKSIAATRDGGCIAVGRTSSTDKDLEPAGPRGDFDAMIVKYDADLNMQWIRLFGGSEFDEFTDVGTTSDGGYIVVGATQSKDGDISGLSTYDKKHALIVKYNASGEVEWKQIFGGSGEDMFNSVAIAQDKGFVAAGSSSSNDGSMNGANQGDNDAILVKYSTEGTMEWKSTFGGTDKDEFLDVKAVGSEFIVSGHTKSTDGAIEGLTAGGSYDALLVKFDKTGTVTWKQIYGGGSWDRYNAVLNKGSTYYVVGSTLSDNLPGLTLWGKDDCLIAQYK